MNKQNLNAEDYKINAYLHLAITTIFLIIVLIVMHYFVLDNKIIFHVTFVAVGISGLYLSVLKLFMKEYLERREVTGPPLLKYLVSTNNESSIVKHFSSVVAWLTIIILYSLFDIQNDYGFKFHWLLSCILIIVVIAVYLPNFESDEESEKQANKKLVVGFEKALKADDTVKIIEYIKQIMDPPSKLKMEDVLLEFTMRDSKNLIYTPKVLKLLPEGYRLDFEEGQEPKKSKTQVNELLEKAINKNPKNEIKLLIDSLKGNYTYQLEELVMDLVIDGNTSYLEKVLDVLPVTFDLDSDTFGAHGEKSALWLAIENGNDELVRLLLKKGADVHYENEYTEVNLFKSIARSSSPYVMFDLVLPRMLEGHIFSAINESGGASSEDELVTPLEIAIEKNDDKLVQKFLQTYSNPYAAESTSSNLSLINFPASKEIYNLVHIANTQHKKIAELRSKIIEKLGKQLSIYRITNSDAGHMLETNFITSGFRYDKEDITFVFEQTGARLEKNNSDYKTDSFIGIIFKDLIVDRNENDLKGVNFYGGSYHWYTRVEKLVEDSDEFGAVKVKTSIDDIIDWHVDIVKQAINKISELLPQIRADHNFKL